jgi:hypothetical protein
MEKSVFTHCPVCGTPWGTLSDEDRKKHMTQHQTNIEEVAQKPKSWGELPIWMKQLKKK